MTQPVCTTRPFLTCQKCGGKAMGRYKDSEGNPLCYGCKPRGQKNRTAPCKICGTGHFQTVAPDMCYRCYQREKVKEERGYKICPTCNKAIRSAMPFMTQCIKCMGKKEYNKALDQYKASVN